jgi:HSP20 family protein
MTLLKYNPFTELDSHVQDTLNRFFSEPSARPWTPAVDIFENENELVLKADIPDVELKDVDIRLEHNTLSVKGERRFEQNDNSKGYHRIERSYGVFARSFQLPETVDTDKVKADYRNGVLTITLPKKELAKPRSIRVEVSNN